MEAPVHGRRASPTLQRIGAGRGKHNLPAKRAIYLSRFALLFVCYTLRKYTYVPVPLSLTRPLCLIAPAGFFIYMYLRTLYVYTVMFVLESVIQLSKVGGPRPVELVQGGSPATLARCKLWQGSSPCFGHCLCQRSVH